MLVEYVKHITLKEESNSQYDEYLSTHIRNVRRAYNWLKTNLPEVLSQDNYIDEISYYGELEDIIKLHDRSKYNKVPIKDNYYDLSIEYDPYVTHFYGTRTPESEKQFDKAWLSHIHQNPHHWQHWLLQHDSGELEALDMPYVFIIEMICDHWSFSWKSNNLLEIFSWYEKNKSNMILSDKTRKIYETILEQIKQCLEEKDNG